MRLQGDNDQTTTMTESVFTLNPGIPEGPEGPEGQIAGHCRGQRRHIEQLNSSYASSACAHYDALTGA